MVSPSVDSLEDTEFTKTTVDSGSVLERLTAWAHTAACHPRT